MNGIRFGEKPGFARVEPRITVARKAALVSVVLIGRLSCWQGEEQGG